MRLPRGRPAFCLCSLLSPPGAEETPLRSRPPPPSAAERMRGPAAGSRVAWRARWAGCSPTNRRDPRRPDHPAGPARPASSRLRRGPAIPTTRWWTSWKRPSRCRGGGGACGRAGACSAPRSHPLASLPAGLLRLAGQPGLRERHRPGGDPHR